MNSAVNSADSFLSNVRESFATFVSLIYFANHVILRSPEVACGWILMKQGPGSVDGFGHISLKVGFIIFSYSPS